MNNSNVDYKKILSKNLRYYRELNNIKSYELANLLHVSKSTISSWEKGTRSPDIDNLIKLCDIFNVKLDTLIKNPFPQKYKPHLLKFKDIFKQQDVSILIKELTFLEQSELDEIKLAIQLIEKRREKK